MLVAEKDKNTAENVRKETARRLALIEDIAPEDLPRHAPDGSDIDFNAYQMRIALAKTFQLGRSKKSWVFWAVKRCADLIVCSAALIILSPLFALISLMIYLEDGGPIFFVQERVGERFKLFKILKFRTMYHGVCDKPRLVYDRDTNQLRRPKLYEDPRITKVGFFLRRWSLDELPQLINIIKGDMSLIGPRALCVQEALSCSREAMIRYSVPAGLTGLSQITVRGASIGKERFDGDYTYIHNLGYRQEAKIFLATFRVLRDQY